MKRMMKALSLLLAIVMMLAVFAACAKQDEPTEGNAAQGPQTQPGTEQQPDGEQKPPAEATDRTLKLGTTVAPTSFDGVALGSNPDPSQMAQVFECLLKLDPKTNELVGCLAEAYEWEDELTLLFHLREGVTFNNGDPMTAEDVFWSLKDVAAAGIKASYWTNCDWEKSGIVDENTVRIAYSEGYGPALNMFATWNIFNKAWSETATADDWYSSPVGTGPYICTENVDGSHTSYIRNENYWGELPECTAVSYRYYSELSAMFIDLETGAIDGCITTSQTDAARVLAGEVPDNISYSINEVKDVLQIILCEYVPEFQDERVREAVYLSLDRNAIATAVYGDLFKEATSILPVAVDYYEAQDIPASNIERAKELMAEAGYADGFEIYVVTTQDNATLGEVVQACLAEIGITMTFETYDPPTAIPMMQAGETDLCFRIATGGAFVNEPGMLLTGLSPTTTLKAAGFTSPEWTEYYNAATYTFDTEARAEAYSNCQKYLIEGYHVVPVCERVVMQLWNSDKIAEWPLVVADQPNVQYLTFVN